MLRHFAQRIKQDFVLLPCDFLPSPSLSLTRILNKFRTEATYDGAIVTTCFYEAHKPEKGALTEEWGPFPTPVPIVWDEPSGSLLYVDTANDVDNNGEDLELSMGLLSRYLHLNRYYSHNSETLRFSYPRTRLSGGLQDAHVYVCRRSVLDVLQEKSRFDSIREEFIPWLCKPQYSHVRRAKYGHSKCSLSSWVVTVNIIHVISVLNPTSNSPSQSDALRHSTLYTRPTEHSRQSSGSNGHDLHPHGHSPVDDDEEEDLAASLRVGIIVHKTDEGYAARANTLHSYLDLNRHVSSPTRWLCLYYGTNNCAIVSCSDYICVANGSRKSRLDRSKGTNIRGFDGRTHHQGGRTHEYQKIRHWQTLCDW